MATEMQSNPVYFSFDNRPLNNDNSNDRTSQTAKKTVILHKRNAQDSFGIYVGEDVPSGLYVITVERDSPAARAQIQPGDRVLAINGQLVSNIPGNPKQMLIKTATQCQSLSLTIQSTDIFQALNVPLQTTSTSTTTNLTNRHTIAEFPSIADIGGDLESYIKSLFVGEDIEILPSTSSGPNQERELILKSKPVNPYSSTRPVATTSLPNSYSAPVYPAKKTRRAHRHRKRVLLETRETQTSLQDDSATTQPSSPTRPPPSMGISQLMSRNVPPSNNERPISSVPEPKVQERNSIPEISATPPSSVSSNPTPRTSMNNQPPPSYTPSVSQPPSYPPPPPIPAANSPEPETQGNAIQHMVDVVHAAMNTSRGRDPKPPNPPTAPSTSRETLSASVLTRNPPPSASDGRPGANEGTYSVSGAQRRAESQNAPQPNPLQSSIRGDGIREVRLQRNPTFTGYGFHIQYNKVYYLVHGVEKNSPAEKGNLRLKDVIHMINNQPTASMPHPTFVQNVNSSDQVVFLVQDFDNYIQAYPESARAPGKPNSSR